MTKTDTYLSTRTRARVKILDYTPAALIFVLTIIIWEVAVQALNIPKYLIPAPSEILGYLGSNFQNLIGHTWMTLLETMAGFILGSSIAFILSIVMAHFRWVERSIYPHILTIRSLPIIAIAPLLILWLGFNIYPIIVTSAIVCFFPMLVNGITGFRATDQTTIELMHSLNASTVQIFRYVRIYDCLPYIFSALKVSLNLALIGAIVGEWIATDEGLGYLILYANAYLKTTLLFAALIILAIIGIILFLIITIAEGYVLKWREPTK